ncbi:unnamed protein product [Pieris brassicae]|uniref:Uncharacterized protein n=1 Tax=Pieris brassicae TaxID=7116 RepID=A0A9P0X3U3_PIEBR|nr:unnamed protein product [Pieris brassicae]
MSDIIDVLAKEYDKNVLSEESRSVGLFTIPEYPELEARGMWSIVLDTLLTTLRFLAPATLLTIFWTHHTFFFDILKYIDSAFRTVIFSNEDKKKEVIQWLSEVGPIRIEELDTVWHHGWIVCGALDAALPGACAGHPPTRLSLKHAQSIADHYLGVEPMFTRQELDANDSLSKHEEWKLVTFLDKVRLGIAKLSPPSATNKTKPVIPVAKPTQFSLDYIARGSGLTAAQVNNKMFFKIYPTAQQSLDPGDITIQIRGPMKVYGLTTLPPILGKAQMIRQTLLGAQAKPSNYTENALPVIHGTAYLRNYGNNDMKKTYYIPKRNYDINITVENNRDFAKIGYTVPTEGKYEITITSRDVHIVSSPFIVTASKNIVDNLEKDSFNLEDGEEIDIVDVKTDRKVVLRIVDFVTEKMLLKDNGALEKISDDEARNLMELNNIETTPDDSLNDETKINDNGDNVLPTITSEKFYSVANKVLKMNRVCQALQEKNKNKQHQKPIISETKAHGAVPDVVNSTFEKNIPTNLYEREKIIIPESISVSLMMDKPHLTDSDKLISSSQSTNMENDTNKLYNRNLQSCKILQDLFEDDSQSIDTVQSTNNPFLSDMYDTTFTEKEFGSFITSEYEANNSQNEECHSFSNPFINFDHTDKDTEEHLGTFSSNFEEGSIQTDLISIGTDDILDHIEIIEHEYTNPFITIENSETTPENTRVTDFIIGAPVSLPSIVGNSIKETKDNEINFHESFNFRKDSENVSFLSSHESLEQKEDPPVISPFHSLGSDAYNFLSQGNLQRSRNISPKDLWDSAYVSIDDSASSTDNNYNHNDRCISETFVKSNYINNDLVDNGGVKSGDTWRSEQSEENLIHDDFRGLKWEFKRQVFTPIIEENEKSITCGTKDNIFETDTVSRAFAELNEIYDDIFPKPDESSVNEGSVVQNLEDDFIIEKNDIRVDSASENLSDVKRLAAELEGSISVVQANDTESVSASRSLDVETKESFKKDKTEFGDAVYSNIVLEKKMYWDEKIRLIEAKNMEEFKLQQKRKRLSAKHFRHNDSLTKRKGKQIIRNFLNSASSSSPQSRTLREDEDSIMSTNYSESSSHTVKLVEKWKSFWDEKLEDECKEKLQDMSRTSLKSANNSVEIVQDTESPTTFAKIETDIKDNETEPENSLTPTKHELPEEVFKAFETCPKRFFGTSRKHILNKIDSFLGKPSIEHTPKPESSNFNHETGLVSSRISMFHNISHTEDIPWKRKRPTPKLCNIKSVKINDIRDNSEGIFETSNQRLCDSDKPCSVFKDGEIDTSFTIELSLTDIDNKIVTADVDNSNEMEKKCQSDITETVTADKEGNDVDKENLSTIPHDIQNKDIVETNERSHVKCRKLKTFSKSEMDLFSKTCSSDGSDNFDKHKSVEDLPKINVKNFITLYEDVSKSTQSTLTKTNAKPFTSRTSLYNSSSSPGTPCKSYQNPSASKHFIKSYSQLKPDTLETENIVDTRCSSVLSETESAPETDKKYLSLSDIELEIVEKKPDIEPHKDNKPDEISQVDYKSRFKMAKQYFQSLEELRDVKKDRKLSECKIVLNNHSIESLEDIDEKPKRKSRKTKSKSMPSSEIAKIWNEMQAKGDEKDDKKLIKISEKFNVEDLFEDVMEGRLSRQGSLRGIPHKKAVLEAFKSMENLSDTKLNSYDMAVSPWTFSQQNQVKNAQTYLSEYPYLPTTDPSNFQPRFDASASGLISYNELKSRPRRNSVPDIRLNPSFTEDL